MEGIVMTDRRKCRKCRYSGFTLSNSWTGCTYIIRTGEKRPHDGDICYGYELKTDKRKHTGIALKGSAPVITADAKRTESRSEIPAYEPISPRDGYRMWLNIMMM
jgi:hypothetical protein